MRALAWFTGFSPLARRGGLMVLGGAGLAVLLVAMPFLWLGGLKEQAATDKTQYDLIAARAQRLAGSGGVRLTAADEPARIQAVAEGRDPGDLTTMDDPTALQQIKDLLG